MRTSWTFLFLGTAAVACATSQSIDPLATKGQGSSPFDDAAANGGGSPGTGGDYGSGGFPGSGGIVPTGGLTGTGGAPPGTGGKGNGGSMPMGSGGGSGGVPPATGGRSSGGASGSSPGGSAGSCATGEKMCNGACVRFGPANGCSAPSCTACSMTAPQNGVLACNAQGQCDFNCNSGFNKVGSNCVSATAGDGGGSCNLSSCGACILPGSTACCKSGGGCGCTADIGTIVCL